MKFRAKENILIAVSTLRKIMEIFFGPFLIAYFIKTSTESLIDLSIYNIMNYFVLGTLGFVVGYIVRNKFQVGMFRIGVISNFIYILLIILLKEKILNYLCLISFIYGFSLITYYFPYNLFITTQIENKNRTTYEIKRKTASLLANVLTPICLGSLITTTNFYLTAAIIAIISFIQIILSFFIKPIEDKNYKFTPIKSFKILMSDREVNTTLKIDFLKGLSISDGVLNVIVTVLIFNAFKTDMNLGIISSVSAILTIIMSYIYSKVFKNKNDKLVVLFCSIVPVGSLLLLLGMTNNITLILYYMVYNVLINVLCMIIDIRLFNIANTKLVKEDNHIEFWAIREAILNLGRILGYSILLLIAILNKNEYLNYYMIFLTLSITVMGFFVTKVGKHEEN